MGILPVNVSRAKYSRL